MGNTSLFPILALLLLLLSFPLTHTQAQTKLKPFEEDEPLIPGLDKSADETQESKIQDPFEPKIPQAASDNAHNLKTDWESEPVTEPTASATTENVSPSNNNNAEGFDASGHKDNFVDLEKSQDTTNAPPPAVEDDPLAQELLNGNDEDFKPAPLKIDGAEEKAEASQAPEEEKVKKESEKRIFEPEPEKTIQPEVPPTLPVEGENKKTDDPSTTTKPEAEKEATSSITLPTDKDKKDGAVKTSDLISEEVDPWDDPRKQISTSCRMQLERIKKKKIMLQRADGTHLRLQEALVQATGAKSAQMKELSSKIGRKVLDLKKEIFTLKEKAIRLGCPGVDL